MANCEECGKTFGFLEKTYETTSGKKLCAKCVQEIKEKEKSVEIPDEPHIPVEKDYGNYVSLTDDPYVPQSKESKKDKWEFRVVKLSVDVSQVRTGKVTIEKFEETINKMGEDGWELVSVVPLNVMLMQREGIPQPAMIFKRKV